MKLVLLLSIASIAGFCAAGGIHSGNAIADIKVFGRIAGNSAATGK